MIISRLIFRSIKEMRKMSKCKDCKYCDLELLKNKKWYCNNSDIVFSAISIYDLPFDSEHFEYCFELWEGMEK